MNRNKIIFFIMISLVSLTGLPGNYLYSQPKIIFDTDFGGDADDLGALAMLNQFHNKKECELLAVLVWSTEEFAVLAIDAVNTFYGNPDIPIGVRKDGKYFEEWHYSKPIAEAFAHDETYESASEATQLYRKILSQSKDKDVIIVTVGPLKNIENLLNSPGDNISPLTGKELVELKVKEFVIMGGQYPEGKKEWNFDGNMPGVTKNVIQVITLPITFSGYELGEKIKTGQVFNKLNPEHPLYVGFLHFSSHASWIKGNFKGQILNNSTYDQTAVLYAVKNGVGLYWDKIGNGVCIPDETGGNTWLENMNSNHSYLKLKVSVAEIGHIIDSLMLGEF